MELVASTDDVTRLGVGGLTAIAVDELACTCDGIIALGGDGTLLGAMRLVSGRPVPVLGVNFGNLGFLAEVEGAELDRALSSLAEGGSTVEMRGCLVVRHAGGESLAFNDAVVARVPGEGLVEATHVGRPAAATGATAATRSSSPPRWGRPPTATRRVDPWSARARTGSS